MKILDNLSERIYKIIITKPFNAESYSEIYTDIALTFINTRLDSMLSNFNIDSNNNNTKINSYIKKLNIFLESGYNQISELFFLIPELENVLDKKDLQGVKSINMILTKLKKEYGIKIEESKLKEHMSARHNITFPDEILSKMLRLSSHFLKINRIKGDININSLLSQTDLPFHNILFAQNAVSVASDEGFPFRFMMFPNYLNAVLFSFCKDLTWEKLIFFYELMIISKLIPAHLNIKMQKFIHSIYKFINENAEIENLQQYKRDNDIWKLSRINSDFRFVDKSSNETFMITKYKLELLEIINKQPDLLNSYNIHPVISSNEFKSGEKYIDSNIDLIELQNNINQHSDWWITHPEVPKWDLELVKLQNKINQLFDSWIHDPEVAKWDIYWIKMEKHNNDFNFTSKVKEVIEESLKPELLNSSINPLNNYNNSEVNKGRNSIIKKGVGWVVRYNDTERILNDINGIYYFSLCLKAPEKKFKYIELLQVKEIADTLFSSDMGSIKKSLKNIDKEIVRMQAEFQDDPTAYEVELEKLETERKRLLGLIKSRNLKSKDYTLQDKKNSDAFTKACRVAKAHCRKVFPEFYQHIHSNLIWRNGYITYSGNLDWN